MGRGIVRLQVRAFHSQTEQIDVGLAVDESGDVELELAAAATIDLIGGTAPQLPYLTTATYLVLQSSVTVLVACNGAAMPTEAVAVTGETGVLALCGVSLTAVQVHNGSGQAAKLRVQVGGT